VELAVSYWRSDEDGKRRIWRTWPDPITLVFGLVAIVGILAAAIIPLFVRASR